MDFNVTSSALGSIFTDDKELGFPLQLKLRTGQADTDVSGRTWVTCNNTLGLTAVYKMKEISIYATADFFNRSQDPVYDGSVCEDVAPLARFPADYGCQHIAFSCDGRTLFVSYIHFTPQEVVSFCLYDVPAVLQGHHLAFSSTQFGKDVACIWNVAWNPEDPSMFSMALDSDAVYLYKVEGTKCTLSATWKGEAMYVCWSPKGKQLVAGLGDGHLIQLDHKLTVKRTFPADAKHVNSMIHAVFWQSTYTFFVLYARSGPREEQESDLVIVQTAKDQTMEFIDCSAVWIHVNDRKALPFCYFAQIPEWRNLVVVMTAYAADAYVFERDDTTKKWAMLEVDQSLCMSIPLSQDYEDKQCVGMGLCLTCPHKVPLEAEKFAPPGPVFLYLSNDGLLTSYYSMNARPGSKPVTLASPQPIPPDLSRKGTIPYLLHMPVFPPSFQAAAARAAEATSASAVSHVSEAQPGLAFSTESNWAAKGVAPYDGVQNNRGLFSLTGDGAGDGSSVPLASLLGSSTPAESRGGMFGSSSFGSLTSGQSGTSAASTSASLATAGAIGTKPLVGFGLRDATQEAPKPSSFSELSAVKEERSATAPGIGSSIASAGVTPSGFGLGRSGGITTGKPIDTTSGTGPDTGTVGQPVASKPSVVEQPVMTQRSGEPLEARNTSNAMKRLYQRTGNTAQVAASSGHTTGSVVKEEHGRAGLGDDGSSLLTKEDMHTYDVEADKKYDAAMRKQVSSFRSQLAQFVHEYKRVNREMVVGDENIKRQLLSSLDGFSERMADVKVSLKEFHEEVIELRSQLYMAVKLKEECDFTKENQKDPSYLMSVKDRPLDPYTQEHLEKIMTGHQALQLTIESLACVVEKRWRKLQGEPKQSASAQRLATMDSLTQAVRYNDLLINGLTGRLSTLKLRDSPHKSQLGSPLRYGGAKMLSSTPLKAQNWKSEGPSPQPDPTRLRALKDLLLSRKPPVIVCKIPEAPIARRAPSTRSSLAGHGRSTRPSQAPAVSALSASSQKPILGQHFKAQPQASTGLFSPPSSGGQEPVHKEPTGFFGGLSSSKPNPKPSLFGGVGMQPKPAPTSFFPVDSSKSSAREMTTRVGEPQFGGLKPKSGLSAFAPAAPSKVGIENDGTREKSTTFADLMKKEKEEAASKPVSAPVTTQLSSLQGLLSDTQPDTQSSSLPISSGPPRATLSASASVVKPVVTTPILSFGLEATSGTPTLFGSGTVSKPAPIVGFGLSSSSNKDKPTPSPASVFGSPAASKPVTAAVGFGISSSSDKPGASPASVFGGPAVSKSSSTIGFGIMSSSDKAAPSPLSAFGSAGVSKPTAISGFGILSSDKPSPASIFGSAALSKPTETGVSSSSDKPSAASIFGSAAIGNPSVGFGFSSSAGTAADSESKTESKPAAGFGFGLSDASKTQPDASVAGESAPSTVSVSKVTDLKKPDADVSSPVSVFGGPLSRDTSASSESKLSSEFGSKPSQSAFGNTSTGNTQPATSSSTSGFKLPGGKSAADIFASATQAASAAQGPSSTGASANLTPFGGVVSSSLFGGATSSQSAFSSSNDAKRTVVSTAPGGLASSSDDTSSTGVAGTPVTSVAASSAPGAIKNLFGTQTTTAATSSTAVSSTNTMTVTATSSAVSPQLSAAVPTTLTGSSTSPSAGPLFGSSTSTTGPSATTATASPASVFGLAAPTGSSATAVSSTVSTASVAAPSSAFGQAVASAPATSSLFAAKDNVDARSVFAQAANVSGGSVFGQAATSSPATGNLFSQPSSTPSSSSAFGQSSAPAGSFFGQTATTSAGASSVFSSAPTAPSTGSLFGSAAVTATPSSVFGSAAITAGGSSGEAGNAGGSVFGGLGGGDGGGISPSGGEGGFGGFGLGGSADPNKAAKNPFSSTFSASGGNADLFGSQTANPFISAAAPVASPASIFGAPAASSTSMFGAPSAFGSGGDNAPVASSAFGSAAPAFGSAAPAFGAAQSTFGASTNQSGFGGSAGFGSQSAFGAAATKPAFGAEPTFGAAPAFGAVSAFGGAASFGGAAFGSAGSPSAFGSQSATFGSTAASTAPSGRFSSFANASDAPSFGTLADQGPSSSPFGSAAQQGSGGGIFGNAALQSSGSIFGGGGGGFGTSTPGGFGSPPASGGFGSTSPSKPSFTGYRG